MAIHLDYLGINHSLTSHKKLDKSRCLGSWRTTGDELDLRIGVASKLSSSPDALAARVAIDGTT